MPSARGYFSENAVRCGLVIEVKRLRIVFRRKIAIPGALNLIAAEAFCRADFQILEINGHML